jgi:putative pyruvate formate lyase activating enzyme
VDRTQDELGVCKTGAQALVASYNPHFGEEAPLVGRGGSGTIFFSNCNLLCSFCQNYELSHGGEGRPVSDNQLAKIMVSMQAMGCHNINWVTPSHVVPQILTALAIAVENGLKIPLVYNSSGYDRVETLQWLEGIVDIYMPDFKFWDSEISRRTCDAPDYPEVARRALVEMHRQVGDLMIDEDGLAVKGLLVRHLVLPENLAGTKEVMAFIAGSISAGTYVNVMSQYRPCGRAADIPELSRPLDRREFEAALEAARTSGLHRLDKPRKVFMLW